MLRVLISIAIALPLYELLRYRILRRVRESQRRKARSYAEEHGVRVDLFKFGGKQLVREELLNDRAILRAMEAAADAGALGLADLDRIGARLVQAFDPVDGGLQGAPKFPNPMILEFLARYARRSGDREAKKRVLTTL